MPDNLTAILGMLPTLTVAQLSALRDEAKKHLESKLRQCGNDGTLTDEERADLDRPNPNLLSVIKSIRERTGLSLQDSRAYMDRARARQA
jgi:ribosomal protein L7/L12